MIVVRYGRMVVMNRRGWCGMGVIVMGDDCGGVVFVTMRFMARVGMTMHIRNRESVVVMSVSFRRSMSGLDGGFVPMIGMSVVVMDGRSRLDMSVVAVAMGVMSRRSRSMIVMTVRGRYGVGVVLMARVMRRVVRLVIFAHVGLSPGRSRQLQPQTGIA